MTDQIMIEKNIKRIVLIVSWGVWFDRDCSCDVFVFAFLVLLASILFLLDWLLFFVGIKLICSSI